MIYGKVVCLLFAALLSFQGLAVHFDEDWLRLGKQSIARQEFDLAVHYFSTEIRNNPQNALAYLARAEAYRLKGEMRMATEDKRRAYEIDPTHVEQLLRFKNQLIHMNHEVN